jgi:hypothetical protein
MGALKLAGNHRRHGTAPWRAQTLQASQNLVQQANALSGRAVADAGCRFRAAFLCGVAAVLAEFDAGRSMLFVQL